MAIKFPETETLCGPDFVTHEIETTIDGNVMECCSSSDGVHNSSNVPVQERVTMEDEEPGDVELDNLFSEDASCETLPSEVLRLQKREKMAQMSSGQNSEQIDGIWKKVIIHNASLS